MRITDRIDSVILVESEAWIKICILWPNVLNMKNGNIMISRKDKCQNVMYCMDKSIEVLATEL